MIDRERYHSIRSRLITLHAIITKRTYPVWVFPSHTMTTDQIRNRDSYSSENTIADSDFYNRPVSRKLKIVDIIKLLDNVTPEQPLKINEPNKYVIQIYEVIQEYNALWYELYLTNSNYGSINPAEIQYLERLSFYLFDDYRQIRAYLDNKELRKNGNKETEEGLIGLLGLLSIDGRGKKKQMAEFVSYYDLLTTRVMPYIGSTMPTDAYVSPSTLSQDSLLRQEAAKQQYGIWGEA